MSMASTIEQYRKGTSFGDWADRLEYTFKANKVETDLQKSHFMNLCGPYIYSQLKLLFNKADLDKASYSMIVEKLKQKLDLTEPDFVQRYRFGNRFQQPDESADEFVQAVKLQAEFCGFEGFKDVAIIDRVLVGLRDVELKENLLKEDKLDLAKLDKFITTWNIAKRNVTSLNNQASNQYSYPPPEMVNQVRRPVHERLGYHPYNQNAQNYTYRSGNTQNNNTRSGNSYNRSGYNNYNQNRTQNAQHTHNNQRTVRFQSDNRNNTQRNTNYNNNNRLNGRNNRSKRDYSEVECDYCGELGHIKRKCFTLKNLRRDAVNFIETARPGTSAVKELSELMGRMSTAEIPTVETSDDESYSEWNQDTNWKRGSIRAQRTA